MLLQYTNNIINIINIISNQRKGYNKTMDRVKEFVIKKWNWLIFTIAIIVFLAIAEDVFEQEIMKVDTIAYTFAVIFLRTDWLTKIMKFITNFGGFYIFPIICAIALVCVKDKKIGTTMIINLIFIAGTNLLLKNIVQRPRPDGYRLISETGYSFPSGHSMISTAFYGLLIYFVFINIKNKKIKYTLCVLLSILIVLIGFSRVYLGVHYASDVIAGAFVSIAYLVCFIHIYNIVITKRKIEESKT